MSTMRLERRHVHALLILAFLAGPTWGLAMWLRWRDATPGGRACGSYVTIIEGRLIDDRSGRPIVGAWVLALDRHRARDEDVAEARKRNNEERAYYADAEDARRWWDHYGATTPEARTDTEGRFTLRQWVGTSTLYAFSGRIISSHGNEPRLGPDVLYIEQAGLRPARAEVPHGTFTWREDAEPSYPWERAHWDLGDIRVAGPEDR